jgi:S-formylglutathione hydrolase
MLFSVFLPSAAETGTVASLFWLSGLTCNDENFSTKAGAQQYAEQHSLALVIPDTSPRGEGIADDESYDLGVGAGFYVNATQPPFDQHYQMYDYICSELFQLVLKAFPLDPGRVGISGHSMGGHGAIMLALRNPDQFRSVSAFAPIASPGHCPWGEKALSAYLGNDRETWRSYDSCALIQDGHHLPDLLVDQGDVDPFLENQLKPALLKRVCREHRIPLNYRLQHGYDHSYYFIASFIGEHIAYHAGKLGGG